jgi:hypothetical protein
MKTGLSPMKHAIVLAALLAAGPALAVNVILKEGPESAEEQPAARPATIDLKHTQVIRCVDAKGNLVLQGGPCLPTATAVAASAAPEVIELSALPPRPPAEPPRAAAQEPEMSPFLKGALNGAWKLALIGLACYGLWRLARALRDRYREREVRTETRRHQPRRVI